MNKDPLWFHEVIDSGLERIGIVNDSLLKLKNAILSEKNDLIVVFQMYNTIYLETRALIFI